MSPQDTVERVLKEIHVMFAKCQSYGSSPDKVIVDRKQFLKLLDRLNQGIYDMMEAYEHTRESRNRAELAFQHKGQAMINDASGKADDVYAASVLYTADMLGKVQDLIDQTNESMNEVFRSFKRELRNQKDIVRSNELELESQLQDMADSKVYQGMLEDIRAEQRKEKRKAEDQKKEQAYARRSPYSREHIKIPAVSADVKINEAYFERAGISAEDAKAGYVPSPAPLVTEKPDVKVNLNSEYFRRKAALEAEKLAGQETSDSAEEQERVAQIKENRQDISSETSESRTAEPGKRKGFWKNLTEPVERTFSEEPFPEEGVVSEVDTHKETGYTDVNAAIEKNATDHSLSQNVTEQQPEPTAYENYTGGLETACTDSDKARKTAVSELRSLLSNMEANAEPQYMGEAGVDEEAATGGTAGHMEITGSEVMESGSGKYEHTSRHMQDSSPEGTASADIETYGTLQETQEFVGKRAGSQSRGKETGSQNEPVKDHHTDDRKNNSGSQQSDRKQQPDKDVNKTMEWEIAQEHLLNEENADVLQDIQTSRPSGSKKGTAGWKERMKVLLNEITPKDLDEK